MHSEDRKVRVSVVMVRANMSLSQRIRVHFLGGYVGCVGRKGGSISGDSLGTIFDDIIVAKIFFKVYFTQNMYLQDTDSARARMSTNEINPNKKMNQYEARGDGVGEKGEPPSTGRILVRERVCVWSVMKGGVGGPGKPKPTGIFNQRERAYGERAREREREGWMEVIGVTDCSNVSHRRDSKRTWSAGRALLVREPN